ncbi:acyltransferase family protein [Pseudoduganella sp. OTU4001]|uniref:acyltransferase family protein n=1 Tax=Pseudoduganella sp. OTU4001 TaxID=3043854 RepID=UPI00313AD153
MKLQNVLANDTRDTPAAAPDAHPAYRPDIDGLRAVAVLSVVLFHAFPSALPGGFVGVDIFFIISGFLIGSILIKGMQQGSFSFADFYARRVRRIFPALSLMLASTLAFGWFALFPDEFKMLGKHVFGGAGFVSNFFLWNEVGYFDTAAETKPLLHLWSLGIEEQFYIFWPLLLALAWRLRWNMLGMAVVLGAASFALNIWGVHKFASATFYSPASRVWELLMGACLAYATVNRLAPFAAASRPHSASQRDAAALLLRHAASLLGLGLLAAALVLTTRKHAFPGWWALLPTSGALLLIAAGPAALVNRYLLSNRLMVWVGLVSYPLYLWHWPLLSYAQIIESGVPSAQIRATAVAAALALATATYWLLEKPLRGTARGRAKVIGLSLAMLALAGVGAAIYRADGMPQRQAVVDNALQQKDLILVEDTANAQACKARYGFDTIYKYCLLDDVKKDPTVLLIGDSHAYHHVAGMTAHWRARGENLWMLGTRWPFVDLAPSEDEYQKATPMMLDLALNTPSVKTVIISTALKLHEGNEEGKAIVASFRETIRRFVASGRKVYWINDVPRLDFDPRACIKRAGVASSQTRGECAVPREEYEKSVAPHRAIVDRVLKEFPAVRQLDAADALCDAKSCRVVADGMLLYRDNNHLSHRGDLWVAQRLAQAMAD